MIKLIDFRWIVPPGNNGFVIPFDTTRGPANMTWAAIAAGSAYLVPGDWRAKFSGYIWSYSLRATTNDVTVDEQILTGNARTAADWETQGVAGTFTATAGTTYPREFKPLTPDSRLLVTAGPTGPTALIVWGGLYKRDFGS